jgi:D-tyrosyl-tRNA(Tyr) deacylase
MKVLLQRVASAHVTVGAAEVAKIGRGLLVFVGVAPGDGDAEIQWMADKVLGLRIFPDDDKPMNRSVLDVGGELLVVSQFTLTADTSRGKRPSFTTAAAPAQAEAVYERFAARLAQSVPVRTGVFGADMQVGLVNDGPVTFLLER